MGQRYILKSRGMNCGAEIHLVEQKFVYFYNVVEPRNILWNRDTCCGAEVYIVEQSRGNFCFAEVHIYILEELKHIVGHLWFM